jgi:lipopolysaccharide export system protein LptC
VDRRRAYLDRLISWSPVLLLGSLAALTYWLDAQVQPPTPRYDGSARHDPDLFLDRFRAITFSASGKPHETLAAQRAEHFPDNDMAEVSSPLLSLTEPDRPTLTVTAERGKLTGDRENAYLSGNVTVQRDPDPHPAPGARSNGAVKVKTEYLHVIPKLERAETDKAVTIEEESGIIRGTGFEFDNKAKTVKLRSGVSGTFQPQPLKK